MKFVVSSFRPFCPNEFIKILAAEFSGCSLISVCEKLNYLGAGMEEVMEEVCCTPSSYFSLYLFSKAYPEVKDGMKKEMSVKESCG